MATRSKSGEESPLTTTVGGLAAHVGVDMVRGFRLAVVDGEDAGKVWVSTGDRCSVGAHPSNDLVLHDRTASRFHCEIRIDARGARLRDLDSTNGTVVEGTSVLECWLRGGSLIRIGRNTVRFEFVAESNRLPISEHTRFGRLRGESVAMRAAFALLERAAAANATVLLEGETGTGKQGAAEALHEHGSRRDQPFVTIDCGSLPENLLDSELFGHEEGAFTGADRQRIGAFEEASGGTVFLDEIGEMPADLQPKLLRTLEQRQIRRLGSNRLLSVDVRVIAATNRDLRAEVNSGRFRPDLYYRLAVVKIQLPPLRHRPEDLPVLVDAIMESLDVPPESVDLFRTESFRANLARSAWRGNVRELKNYLQRCLVFENALPMPAEASAADGALHVDPAVPWNAERSRVLAEFERAYLRAALERYGGKVAVAARAAELNRVYMYKLLRRHGLLPKK